MSPIRFLSQSISFIPISVGGHLVQFSVEYIIVPSAVQGLVAGVVRAQSRIP